MIIDLFAALVVVGAAALGWHRGTVNMALWAAGLLVGYGAALLLFRPLGSAISSLTQAPPLIAYPTAGMIAMLLTSSLANRFARRFRAERAARIEGGWTPPTADSVGGMALGATYGGAVGLIVGWAVSSLGGLAGGATANVQGSFVGRASVAAAERAVRVAARTALGDPFLSNALARMLADPDGASAAFGSALEDPRLRELAESASVRNAVRTGDVGTLSHNRTVHALATDEAFVTTLRDFGVLEAGSGPVSPDALADAITTQAGPALRAVDVLRNDPEIRRILSDGPLREALDNGDAVGAATSAEFAFLFDRVLEELRRQR